MEVLANVITVQYINISNQTHCTSWTYAMLYVNYISVKLAGRGKRISGRIKLWLPPGKKEVGTQWMDGVKGDTVYLILLNVRTTEKIIPILKVK